MNGEDGTSKSSTVGRTSQPALKQCRNATSVRKLLMKLCWWVTHFNFFMLNGLPNFQNSSYSAMFLCFIISWFVEELPTFLVLSWPPSSAPSPRHGSSRWQLRWGPSRSPGPAAVCGRQSVVEVRMIYQVFFCWEKFPLPPKKMKRSFPCFWRICFLCHVSYVFCFEKPFKYIFSTFLKC